MNPTNRMGTNHIGTNQMGKTTTVHARRPEPAQVAAAARISLARWLAAGRLSKNLTIEDIARVTKIPPRTLERLEAGSHEGLPAEVFVKGFVRSFARAVGLDEQEALLRYSACGVNAASVPTAAARALVDSMAELAPIAAAKPTPTMLNQAVSHAVGPALIVRDAPSVLGEVPAQVGSTAETAHAVNDLVILPLLVEPLHAVETLSESSLAAGSVAMPVVTVSDMATVPVVDEAVSADSCGDSGAKKKPRSPRKKKPTKRELLAAQASAVTTDAGLAATEVAVPPVDGDAVVTQMMVVDASSGVAQAVASEHDAAFAGAAHVTEGIDVVAMATTIDTVGDVTETTETTEMVASHDVWVPKMPALSIPWTRPAMTAPMMPLIPTLVIDDSDPESAERDLVDRDDDKAPRRSLIPSILLENDDRGRQGGLTLAVIILLIAATLTLSYLMRRPGAGGDGMTQQLSTPTTFVG